MTREYHTPPLYCLVCGKELSRQRMMCCSRSKCLTDFKNPSLELREKMLLYWENRIKHKQTCKC